MSPKPWTTETAREALKKRWGKLKESVSSLDATTPVESSPRGKISFETVSLSEAIEELAKLRKEYESALRIVSERQSRAIESDIHCAVCKNKILPGRWNFKDDGYRNPRTGAMEPKYTDTNRCYELFIRARQAERDKKLIK